MTFDILILGVAAVLFGVALVALLIWAFKAFFGRSSAGTAHRGREKRLGVVETAPMDGKRQLWLIRRDNVEHLIMVGGPVDVVVETGIHGGPPRLDPPHDGVVIAKSDPR